MRPFCLGISLRRRSNISQLFECGLKGAYGDDIFFGFAILNHDLINAEWGYVSFSELKRIRYHSLLEVDCETEEAWQIKKAGEIEIIRRTEKI